MRFWDWLFPSVETARREALARIDSIQRRSDEIDAAEEPIRRIAAEVAPMIMEAEQLGLLPDTLLLTRADIAELEGASRRSSILRGETFWGHGRDFRLYGLSVSEGAERRVLCRQS